MTCRRETLAGRTTEDPEWFAGVLRAQGVSLRNDIFLYRGIGDASQDDVVVYIEGCTF